MVKLSNIFSGMKPIKRSTDVEGVISKLKSIDTGVSSVDSVLKSVPFSSSGGKMLVNGKSFSSIGKDMLSGRLSNAMKNMGKTVDVPTNAESAFRTLIKKDTPLVDLADRSDVIKAGKSQHPSLDVKDLSKLSSTDKKKVTSMYEKLKKVAGTTLVVGGVIGVVYIGVDMWKSLQDAIDNLNGCWLVTKTSSGDIERCKIFSRKCSGDQSTNACAGTALVPARYVPGYVLLNQPDIFLPISLELGGPETETEAREFLTENVEDYLEKLDAVTKEITIKCPESGCYVCSISTDILSPNYISPDALSENQTLECINNATLLDLIGDISQNIKDNLFDFFKVGNLGWIINLVYFVIGGIILAYGWKFISNIFKEKQRQPMNETLA